MCSVYGVGINDCKGWSNCKNGRRTKLPYRIYSLWSLMLMRVYSEAYLKTCPSYRNVTICERWLTLSNFAKDIQELPNYKLWRDNPGQRVCLDKDIRIKGNKEYRPEACMFITASENSKDACTRNPAFYRKVCPQKVKDAVAKSLSKAIICTCPDGTEKKYQSMSEAARQDGFGISNISACCRGKANTHRGCKFRYA